MVSRQTNFGERSEPALDRGGKLQSVGVAQSNVLPLQRAAFCRPFTAGVAGTPNATSVRTP